MGPIPVPAIPPRLNNSGGFDKTTPAPLQRSLTFTTGRPAYPYFPGVSVAFRRSGLPPVQQPLTRWPPEMQFR